MLKLYLDTIYFQCIQWHQNCVSHISNACTGISNGFYKNIGEANNTRHYLTLSIIFSRNNTSKIKKHQKQSCAIISASCLSMSSEYHTSSSPTALPLTPGGNSGKPGLEVGREGCLGLQQGCLVEVLSPTKTASSQSSLYLSKYIQQMTSQLPG